MMDSHFWNNKTTNVTGQEMSDVLEPENPFDRYARDAVSGQLKTPTTRQIRRRKGNSEAEDKQVLLALDLRRRAQNRASQRAFRERKRSHTEDLQQQLDKLHETYRSLQETYQQKVNELSKMQIFVEELSFEIAMLHMKPEALHSYFDGIEGTSA